TTQPADPRRQKGQTHGSVVALTLSLMPTTGTQGLPADHHGDCGRLHPRDHCESVRCAPQRVRHGVRGTTQCDQWRRDDASPSGWSDRRLTLAQGRDRPKLPGGDERSVALWVPRTVSLPLTWSSLMCAGS